MRYQNVFLFYNDSIHVFVYCHKTFNPILTLLQNLMKQLLVVISAAGVKPRKLIQPVVPVLLYVMSQKSSILVKECIVG